MGSTAELKSLAAHAKLRDGLSENGPDYITRLKTMNILEKMYANSRWEIPEDFLGRSHFDRTIMESIQWQSSPGYPYLLRGNTNEKFFGPVGSEKFQQVCNELWSIVQFRLRGGEPDYIRLFIKSEPLKLKKLENFKYRLISSVSIVDQIIDSMLFLPMNSKLIENCMDVPNKAGWSPYCGGWRAIPVEKWTAIDKSAWDWSVRIWLLEMELDLRVRLCLNINDEWKQLAYRRYKEMFVNPTYINSGGFVFRQRNPGVMKSGCVNTISTNSNMQTILHVITCVKLGRDVPALYTMGDDTLQAGLCDKQYLEELQLHCIVKHAIQGNEFAGFRFCRTVEPLYKGKHAYQLLHIEPKFMAETIESYVLLYHRSVMRNWFEKLANDLKVPIMTREMRDLIWDALE